MGKATSKEEWSKLAAELEQLEDAGKDLKYEESSDMMLYDRALLEDRLHVLRTHRERSAPAPPRLLRLPSPHLTIGAGARRPRRPRSPLLPTPAATWER